MKSKFVLTFDVDWCSDEVLKYTIDKLVPLEIPATFFITHESPLIDIIRGYDFFDLGIHPNFNINSTHGKTTEEVIGYCMQIVPEAIRTRSHGLNISSNILIELMKNNIIYDYSLFLPSTQVSNYPFSIDRKSINRLSYNWEDDYNFHQDEKIYELSKFSSCDVNILDFHPIHIFLNSFSQINYQNYKNTGKRDFNHGVGTCSFLDEIISQNNKSIEVVKISEVERGIK